MGKSQGTPNRFAVGYHIAVGVNGVAGHLEAAAPKGLFPEELDEFPKAPAQCAGELYALPRAPGSWGSLTYGDVSR
jgi:hypothetical protein